MPVCRVKSICMCMRACTDQFCMWPAAWSFAIRLISRSEQFYWAIYINKSIQQRICIPSDYGFSICSTSVTEPSWIPTRQVRLENRLIFYLSSLKSGNFHGLILLAQKLNDAIKCCLVDCWVVTRVGWGFGLRRGRDKRERGAPVWAERLTALLGWKEREMMGSNFLVGSDLSWTGCWHVGLGLKRA